MSKLHPIHASLLIPTLLLAAAACKSADRLAADADRDVYEIVRQRRAELDIHSAFSVEVPEATLRRRILSGESIELPPLTLVEALRIAAEGNRNYQVQREALYLTALDLTLERWDFAVQESGTLGATLFPGRARDASVRGGLGLARLLGSGMRIISEIGFELVRDISSGDAWSATTNLSLNITQPILRGFGRSIVEEPLTQAERDVLYQARSYETFRRDLAVDVANRFFRLLSLYDRLANEEANHARRTALRERNEAFAQAGKLTDVDVDQARQDELAARDRLVEARRALEAALDDFKFFLGLPIETPLEVDLEGRSQVASWEETGRLVGEKRGMELALGRRLDYQTTLDRVADAERRIVVAADALRAGLDVSLDGSVVSERNKPLDYRGKDVNWELSIDFDAPIDRLPERNAYREALIVLQAAERSAEEEQDRLRAEIREALRNLAAARESHEIQGNAVVLAERRVESSELSLEAGRAETRDVLESQNALIGAQNDASAAYTEYILAGIALYRTMECLSIDENGIQLDSSPFQAADKESP